MTIGETEAPTLIPHAIFSTWLTPPQSRPLGEELSKYVV
jgi:hypothetical protein